MCIQQALLFPGKARLRPGDDPWGVPAAPAPQCGHYVPLMGSDPGTGGRDVWALGPAPELTP